MGRLTDVRDTADLKPGDQRTVVVDGRNVTIYRTEREFALDLCDAYNAARYRHDVEWYVSNGELKIRFTAEANRRTYQLIESRQETERARHTRMYLEREGRREETNG